MGQFRQSLPLESRKPNEKGLNRGYRQNSKSRWWYRINDAGDFFIELDVSDVAKRETIFGGIYA
ncbi:hypothetical protein HOLleu_17279 [Holothuria leucospilota]|uniref:Uncharacterized protein n=1 Tax=Holothuria leucospilota TaxID=206669 RepID=A0A9Q1C7D6_HOLLE|nr:hypothetical protein HOLleu_17279 [Holothuria leucospilota]